MRKRWSIHPHDAHRVSRLERDAGVPPVVAQLLLCRGIYDPQLARVFLDARLSDLRDPDELPGASQASQRIWDAVQAGQRITVYGDYDADGMTACAILYLCLKRIGADVHYYVPNRLEEGYGLNNDALDKLAARKTTMVISVDCGIASLEAAEHAQRLGLELIITDHHEMADRLPDAAAIVHPRLPGSAYPFGHLCGAGVAFKLAWSICRRASRSEKVTPALREFLVSAVGIAAIGTVADVVPLVDENRILVRHGLSSLQRHPCLGMAALMKVTGLNKKRELSGEDIAFTLAPRMNAAGRLGQAQLGVELLTTDSPERAQALAEYIHELNSSRDTLERRILKAARKQAEEEFDPVNDPALVLAGAGWHPGVIGIVAGRLADRYHRPVVVIALDQVGIKPGQGSGRSAGLTNLHEAFQSCSEYLVAHGGHAAAAGLKIEESQVDAFRHAFCTYVAESLDDSDRTPEIRIDGEAPFSQLTLQAVRQIEQMAPFGHGNPRPILCAGQIQLAEKPKRIGGGERHLSLRLDHHGIKLRAVAFGQAEWADELEKTPGPLEVAFRPVINEFAGRVNVELQLVDWRPCDS